MFDIKNYSKSVDFLLENAGPVIQYRLKYHVLITVLKVLIMEIPLCPWFIHYRQCLDMVMIIMI